jgi:ATP-binding cassette subfamily B protein/subfamily B ATP-binding cassette protein MsbA
MQNFLHLLRPTLKYRWTIAGIFLSSVLVAIMWGLNIGALFPVLKVAFEDQSVQEWIAAEIDTAEGKLADFQTQLASLPANASASVKRGLRTSIHSEEGAIKFYSYLVPFAEWLPSDPFQTIVIIVLALIMGTVLKGAFVFCNLMLVSRLEERVTFDIRQRFFHKCLKLTQSSFGEQRTSSLMSRFHADVGCLSAAVRAISGTALREPMKMAACLIGASIISPRLLLLSLMLTPITAFTIRKLAGSIKRANRDRKSTRLNSSH